MTRMLDDENASGFAFPKNPKKVGWGPPILGAGLEKIDVCGLPIEGISSDYRGQTTLRRLIGRSLIVPTSKLEARINRADPWLWQKPDPTFSPSVCP
jgi:hypothetical protein